MNIPSQKTVIPKVIDLDSSKFLNYPILDRPNKRNAIINEKNLEEKKVENFKIHNSLPRRKVN